MVQFEAVGRLPMLQDNVAIATRVLTVGTEIAFGEQKLTLDFTVLEGHRFAVQEIAKGAPLLSWGLPFGFATRPILPGQYVCNEAMIEALNGRFLDFPIPTTPNFRDHIQPYHLDFDQFLPGKQVEPYSTDRTFMGYPRDGGRGVGTRNMIVLLGTTSTTASFVQALAGRLQGETAVYSNIDGIVPIAHTEGSGYEQINNRDYLLRTLAGLMVHCNVTAVLAIDAPNDTIDNWELQTYLQQNNYPIGAVEHSFITVTGDWEADLQASEMIVQDWLPMADALRRQPASLAHLSIALQCGGSDAFSGVSGNPLASSVAKEVVRYGGRANFAETDELVGAEAYALQNVRNAETAQTFLQTIAQFKERLAWHGVTAEGNPSGGNRYRGLYNIALKSIGAAMKRHPDVCLDEIVDYGQQMTEPGFYFMNTPGNDLESIAGQVAGGSNLIIFVTGNGSITNFPFVPTIKVMNTSGRYEMLVDEMDINAGAYLDGQSMADLTAESLDYLIDIASGKASKGEAAGHSQISIWRNWQQTNAEQLPVLMGRGKGDGRSIPIELGEISKQRLEIEQKRVRLILPTSLCSGQIARMAAEQLNRRPDGANYVALVHTEGCGVALPSVHDLHRETMLGHALHPLVESCLFLEHGCEKTHNDYWRSVLAEHGCGWDDFGWVSIQLDGGIQGAFRKIRDHFTQPVSERIKSDAPAVGIWADEPVSEQMAVTLAKVVQSVVGNGGTAVILNCGGLWSSQTFRQKLNLSENTQPSLAYGQISSEAGFHLMDSPTSHWSEMVTGLGATGVQMVLAVTEETMRTGHPFVLVGLVGSSQLHDLQLDSDSAEWTAQLLKLVQNVLAGNKTTKSLQQHNINFQLTRGRLGVST